RQQVNQLELQSIRVLQLIDQQRSEAALGRAAIGRVIAQQIARLDQQRREVERVATAQCFGVCGLKLTEQRTKGSLERNRAHARVAVAQLRDGFAKFLVAALDALGELGELALLEQRARLRETLAHVESGTAHRFNLRRVERRDALPI